MKKLLIACLIITLMGCQNEIEKSPQVVAEEKSYIALDDDDILPYVSSYEGFEDNKKGFVLPDHDEVLEVERLIFSPGENINTIGVSLVLSKSEPVVLYLVLDNSLLNLKIITAKSVEVEGLVYHNFKTTLETLKADRHYEIYLKQGDAFSHAHAFKTLKPSFNMAFFGDLQGYKQSQYDQFSDHYQLALETSGPFDVTYLAGDLVDDGISVSQWTYFHQAVSLFRSHLWLSVIGNHDNYHSNTLYRTSFNYPQNGLETLNDRHYFIDIGTTRIAALDTESPSTYEAQKVWLKEIMADVEGFKIVMMHRSLYPMRYNESYIRAFHETFDELAVDLVLSGHDHIYSRTSMVEDNKVSVDQGTTYVIAGSGSGSKFYDEDLSLNRYWRNVVFDDNLPVYGVVQVEDNRLVVRVYAIKDAGPFLIDEFVLTH